MEYRIKALKNEDDAIISFTIDAPNESVATSQAVAQGYRIIGITQSLLQKTRGAHRPRKFSVLLFSRELLSLLTAGLSLMEALETLQKRDREHNAEKIIEGILIPLSRGQSFSYAVAQYPNYFSPLYIASIRASERTGNLPEALKRYTEYQEQMERVQKKLLSACLYPALLILVSAAVVSFLLFYVVPRFGKVYDSFSGNLPFFSKLLLNLGSFISGYGAWIVLCFGAAVGSLIVILNTAAARRKLWEWVTALFPRVEETVRLYELSRLYRTLGMLLKAGIPITRAAKMASPVLTGDAHERLENAAKLMAHGRGISTAMEETGLSSAIAARMLIVGERTGNMGDMMVRIAEFHEEDLSRWLENFTKLFEPILMLGLGLLVGGIVVLMYMPIFELATSIQ